MFALCKFPFHLCPPVVGQNDLCNKKGHLYTFESISIIAIAYLYCYVPLMSLLSGFSSVTSSSGNMYCTLSSAFRFL